MTDANELRVLVTYLRRQGEQCNRQQPTAPVAGSELVKAADALSALIASREVAVKPLGNDATGSADWWKHRALAAEAKNRSMFDEKASLTRELDKAREALKPFGCDDFERPVADENGWTDFGISWCRERIVDWFGPSQFRAARAALSATTDLGRDTE